MSFQRRPRRIVSTHLSGGGSIFINNPPPGDWGGRGEIFYKPFTYNFDVFNTTFARKSKKNNVCETISTSTIKQKRFYEYILFLDANEIPFHKTGGGYVIVWLIGSKQESEPSILQGNAHRAEVSRKENLI